MGAKNIHLWKEPAKHLLKPVRASEIALSTQSAFHFPLFLPISTSSRVHIPFCIHSQRRCPIHFTPRCPLQVPTNLLSSPLCNYFPLATPTPPLPSTFHSTPFHFQPVYTLHAPLHFALHTPGSTLQSPRSLSISSALSTPLFKPLGTTFHSTSYFTLSSTLTPLSARISIPPSIPLSTVRSPCHTLLHSFPHSLPSALHSPFPSPAHTPLSRPFSTPRSASLSTPHRSVPPHPIPLYFIMATPNGLMPAKLLILRQL